MKIKASSMQTKPNPNQWLRSVIYACTGLIALIVFTVIIASPSEEEKQAAFTKAMKVKAKQDSINEINKAIELRTSLSREIDAINESGTKDYSSIESIDQLQIELVVFAAWNVLIKDGQSSDDKITKDLADRLSVKVKKRQTRQFPLMRKKYAELLAAVLWEHDVKASASGKKYEYINLTGGMFAANKNIKTTQEQMEEIFKMFRFKQSRYQWYEGDDEYTYYELETPKDDQSVILTKQ